MVYKRYSEEERTKWAIDKKNELDHQIDEMVKGFKEFPDKIVELIEFMSKFKRYSARNVMLIKAQNNESSFVASMSDFNEMGYKINKGEKSMKIFIPAKKKMFKDGTKWKYLKEADDKTKTKIRLGDKSIEVKEVLSWVMGSVFDISQTNCPNEDIPKIVGLGYDNIQDAIIVEGLKEFCEFKNIELHEKENLTSITLHGYANYVDESITLNKRLRDSNKVEVLLHEISHILIHKDDKIKETLLKSTAQSEFEADALTHMLLKHYNIDMNETMLEHLDQSYQEYEREQEHIPEEKRKTIVEVLSNIKNIFDYTIEDFDKIMSKHIEMSKEIYDFQQSQYPSYLKVRILTNEQNKDLVPLSTEFNLHEFNELMNTLDDRNENRNQIEYYIVDKNVNKTRMNGTYEIGEGISFIDHLNREIMQMNILSSKDNIMNLNSFFNEIKSEVVKGKIYDCKEEIKSTQNISVRKQKAQEIHQLQNDLNKIEKEKTTDFIPNSKETKIKNKQSELEL